MREASVITSTSNPRVQRARRLKRRIDRDRDGAFLIESVKSLEAAVRAGLDVRETFVREGAAEVMDRCRALGLEVTIVTDRVLDAVADAASTQGVVAVVAVPDTGLDRLPGEVSLVLVLAEVRDPGNAGTLVRSAAAAGADAVIFTTESVDPFAPKTVRSSAGSLFAVPVMRGVSLDDVLDLLDARGLTIYLAEAAQGPILSEVDLTVPVAFVVGNEAHGIPGEAGGARGGFLSIPMPGGTESLNAAVAGSILLYETVRQRLGTAG